MNPNKIKKNRKMEEKYMSYQTIRDTREGFVNMGAGDKLIKVESKLLAIVTLLVMWLALDTGFITALITGAVIAFLFPWLVGLIEFFAWVVAIVFSLIWAVGGYFLAGALGGDSPAIGVIGAIIVFIISFFLHKIFAGLGYSSVEKHSMDAWDNTAANTAQTNQTLNEMNTSNVKYCSKCGIKVAADAKFCTECGSQKFYGNHR
ncbi:zinc-ribbon domain-containing protein [bacterium D16-51]|nr:zinc-ribbon domain-containing protein [bacterium D16-59]RKI60085.1 zinc-ribbon domain-containing protein [bacterium D16-51]